MPIDRPGVYEIPAEDYHADNFLPEPSLSASIAKLLVTPGATPMHARHECPRLNPDYEPKELEKFDLGAAAHALLLDPGKFAIIDAADWRTKAAKDERDGARMRGLIPILTHQWESITQMVLAAREQLDAHQDGPMFTDGTPEATIIWLEDGVYCRARLDWRPKKSRIFPDYKSTAASADPDLWSRTMYGMGADMQAAFYLRGIRALNLCDRPEFRFVVQENFKPYALSVIGLMPGALELADRQVARAIEIWRECRRANRWPGYPTRTCWIDVPEYHEARIMAREIREHEETQAGSRRISDGV